MHNLIFQDIQWVKPHIWERRRIQVSKTLVSSVSYFNLINNFSMNGFHDFIFWLRELNQAWPLLHTFGLFPFITTKKKYPKFLVYFTTMPCSLEMSEISKHLNFSLNEKRPWTWTALQHVFMFKWKFIVDMFSPNIRWIHISILNSNKMHSGTLLILSPVDHKTVAVN